MDTTGTIDPITGESTETASTEPAGQGTVEPQAPQGEKGNAGEPQGDTEGGKDNETDTRTQRPFRSKNQTIYELRQKLRDQEGQFTSRLDQLQSKFEEMKNQIQPRGQDRKTSRTFYEAPEDTLSEIFDKKLSAFEEKFSQRLETARQQDQQSVAWKQETSEAAKFIQGQKGLQEDDIADIEEIVRSTPEMQNMSPMQRAKYAMYLYREERGITDRSALKAKAATVVGTPPGGGASAGMTDEEMNREVDKLPKDVSKWTPEDHKRFDTLQSEYLKTRQGKPE